MRKKSYAQPHRGWVKTPPGLGENPIGVRRISELRRRTVISGNVCAIALVNFFISGYYVFHFRDEVFE
jgi:hypothetical protein